MIRGHAPSAAREHYDAIIVGGGPNGLSAAVSLAQAGLSVLVVEEHFSPGGGARTMELTAPGFLHDMCSTVHPLGAGSPFFENLGLERHGLVWVHSPSPLAHVVDEQRVITLERSVEDTAAQLGTDAESYRRLISPFVAEFPRLLRGILGPLRFPSDPWLLARFGLVAFRSMSGLASSYFEQRAAGALLGGMAAHAMLPLDEIATASFGLVLATAGHAVGWPIARGGSQAITQALVARLSELGGELVLGWRVTSLRELPDAKAYLFDLTPRQLLQIAPEELPVSYRRRLQRFRYGPGVFKMDWALAGPIPWLDPACARAATVHLSGTLAELSQAEHAVHRGKVSRVPFTLVVQPSSFDETRAPPGKHIGWAYCHVPHGSSEDCSELIEAQIERFAPGFKALIIARATRTAQQMELYNSNYIGGDINGGVSDLGQLFFRPLVKYDPYATPNPRLFLCSSSTPPGGGVHGMCGHFAARSVLARVFGRGDPP